MTIFPRALGSSSYSHYALCMDKVLAENIRKLRRNLGLNQADFAARVGGGQPNVSKWEAGTYAPSGDSLAAMAALAGCGFEEFKTRPISDFRNSASIGQAADQQPSKTVDGGETAPVLRLDLSYSMGPGRDLDDSYVEGEAVAFDIGFLRGLTMTPPDRLRIVDGVGTSMEPTFHDRDLLLIDINQRDLNAQDRVWACWIFGLGAVKRLRAVAADRVLVISDNPDVDNQEVARKDILIHGRVVGSIKRH